MINVDTVYQRVLAILNKEQRGFLNPQKFNLFANQVQLDILEQYFYDLETFLNVKGNNTVHADQVNILESKIANFEKTGSFTFNDPYFELPSDLYRLSNVIYSNNIVQRVGRKEYRFIQKSPLAKPTNSSPIYIQDTQGLLIYAESQLTTTAGLSLDYIKIPNDVEWAYTNVLGTPQYNAGGSTNFELDASEETDVVLGILKLAGVELRAADVYSTAVQEERTEEQQEIR